MYLAIFYKSHSRRYDNLEEMLGDIERFLELHPSRNVIISQYVD